MLYPTELRARTVSSIIADSECQVQRELKCTAVIQCVRDLPEIAFAQAQARFFKALRR